MTFEEKIFYSLIENIYTISICKINKLSGTIAEVENIKDSSIIMEVPVFQLGNDNFNIKIKFQEGDIVPVLHTKDDLSNFFQTGKSREENIEPKFSRNNAFILPLQINFFEKSMSFTDADIEITGNLKITGDIEVDGTITTTGDITSEGDVVAGEISLINHVHSGVESGSSNTGAAQ